jgi:nucleoside-diphosphate-sugar epimerase
LKLLILGGTVFVGRHVAEQALERGHEVTLFTRGRTKPELFPGAERLTGDRDGNLDPLRGREWDAVIDTSGYLPRIVRDSAQLLSGAAGHYTFISSVSVYDGNGLAGTDPDSPVGTIEDETGEEITGESYGPLKALCEQEVERAFPGRALIVRPGLIVGPDDPTDRFAYWPARIAEGGTVLAPGSPEAATQVIDVRDLAAWLVDSTEWRTTGTFNAVGPEQRLSIGEVLARCIAVSGSDADVVWVDDRALIDAGVELWTDLPLWLGDDPDWTWMEEVDPSPAIAAGLRLRPLDETIGDTLRWHRENREDPGRAGFKMTRSRERELLSLA